MTDKKQTAIHLPIELMRKIRETCGERGMGAEIRRRLEEWQMLHDAGYRVEKIVSVRVVKP